MALTRLLSAVMVLGQSGILLAHPPGMKMRWQPRTQASQDLFLETLTLAQAAIPEIEITSASSVDQRNPTCQLNALRPRISVDPIVDPNNKIRCTAHSTDGMLTASWDLGQTPVGRFGNQSVPKGVTLAGIPAAAIFEAMATMHRKNPDSDQLVYRISYATSPTEVYEWERYILFTGEGDRTEDPSQHVMICSKDHFYAPGSERPSDPPVSCDFIYQSEYDGNWN